MEGLSDRRNERRIRCYQNLVFSEGDGYELALDLYMPRSESPSPPNILVYLHGGGWETGDKRDYLDARGLPLVARGFALASLNYRLAPEFPYPAAIQDVLAALAWLRGNADELSIAPRFALLGASAGGHIASLASSLAAGDGTATIEAVVCWFMPSDLLLSGARNDFERHMLGRSPTAQMLGLGRIWDDADLAREASPRWSVTEATPPHLLIHGDRDAVVPHSHATVMLDALTSRGVSAALISIGGAGHEDARCDSPFVMDAIWAFLLDAFGSS